MATRPQGNGGRPRFGPRLAPEIQLRQLKQDWHLCYACFCNTTGTMQEMGTPTKQQPVFERRREPLSAHLRDSKSPRDLAAKCCERSRIWYYRILEYLACQERKRLGITDISIILENDLFQCCLVACCLEITISSNHLPYDFPLLLQILKLAPYHFLKVIELVLRAEVGLPRSLVRHLAQVEEKVLESLSWTRDSPLWKDIRAIEGYLPTCKQVMLPTQLEDSENTDFQPDTNLPGAGLNLGAKLSDSTDQQRSPSAGSRPQRSNALHLFARKVYSLMGKRLRELCTTLNIRDELRLKIWTCFEHSLVYCTDLMVDRHLDQLLMCAIYIIAKITNVEIPFKLIMNRYTSQPLASKSVCKNVLMSRTETENYLSGNNNNGDHGVSIPTPNTPSTHYPEPIQEWGNLIYFYNQIYTAKMQHFAKQFAPTSARDTPPLSPYPRQWKASPRRQRLSSSHSIYISPHNTETTSPRTPGLSYYFNSSPRECLQKINNMIRTGRPPNKRCYVVSLDREEENQKKGEEEEDGPSAKRLCLDGQSAWQRRLRNVVNDRVTRRDQHQPSPVTKPKLH